MAIHHNRNIVITLLFSLVILLALAPPSSANPVAPDVPYRRDHVNLNRMIKRRAPYALLPRQHDIAVPQVGAVGAGADPSPNSPSSAVPSSTPAAPSATPAQETSQSAQPISSVVPSVLSSAVSFSPFFWRYFRVTNNLNRHRLFRLLPARAQRAQLVPPHPLQPQNPPLQLLPPLLR